MAGAIVQPADLVLAALLLVAMAAALAAIVALDLVVRPHRLIRDRLELLLPRAAIAGGDETARFATRPLLSRRVLALVAWAGGWELVRLPFLAASATLAGVWILADTVFLSGPFLATISALGIAATVLYRLVRRGVVRRQMAFLDSLPAAIDLIVRAAQAGIPVVEAIGVAGREIGPPVGTEFTAIAQLVQLGVDLREALFQAADRVNLVDFDCFSIALVVQRETGGQLSETMRNLSGIIRRRKETRGKVRGLTAEGRTTALVVGALPFFTGGVLSLVSPDYMQLMISDPLGRKMLLVALALIGVGFQMINHMTRMDP